MTSISNPFYDKSFYTAPISYIISSYIREYDISKANINILFMKGVISKEQYDYLNSIDRMSRQVYIGLLQKNDQNVSKSLKEGIKEMRYLFLTSNEINENDVLSIKNDAVFIINKIPTVTKFGNIEFVCKNVYTSFYKLNNKMEIYYSYDMVTGIENIDIKGIREEKLILHKNHFLEFLLVLFNSAQSEPIPETIKLLLDFYERYLNLKLGIEYYREFNSESMYNIKQLGIASSYRAEFLPNDNIYDINISHNLNILRELGGIFASIQNNNKR